MSKIIKLFLIKSYKFTLIIICIIGYKCLDETTNPGGHAVVLIRCDPDCLTLMNSWGEKWGDGGFFRVKDQSVLNEMEFYDVYWTLDDLTDSEKQAYKIEGTRKAKELLEVFPSLSDIVYQCPKCNCSSKVVEYSGNLLEAECPKCHKISKPTNENILRTQPLFL